MLRVLTSSRRWLAHLMVCGVVACGSASPIDVGLDYVQPPPVEVQPSPVEPTPEPPPEDQPGQMDPIAAFDAFIDRSYERGTVSPYCHSSFEACGGLLDGAWVVEDNCNPAISSRDVLVNWGTAQMSLDETACWNAVKRLSWSWRGELKFENGEVIDNRERAQRVDMELTSRCLSATYGTDETGSVSPQVCDALADDFTTCALAGGVCMCSHRTTSTGTVSGPYGVVGTGDVAIAAKPTTTRFAYCVDGDRLLWPGTDGDQHQVVLRRTTGVRPGAKDPTEIPR
jgi:hypothetical protein